MGNESELGKGLFGYRKSAVEQIMSDRDQMLRQAEGRVRAAESKVAELETELNAMQDRNTRMDEQVERLRTQLEEFVRSQGSPSPAPVWTEPQAAEPITPPVVDVPTSTVPVTAVPVTTEPEGGGVEEAGGVADLPIDPVPDTAPVAAEASVTQSAWDEPTAWSEPEPASAYQDYEPQPDAPAEDGSEIAYAPDDRYGYGEVAALTMPEMPEPQAADPSYEGWTSEPFAEDPASTAFASEPVDYEPAAPAFEPEAPADEPEPAPLASDDLSFGYEAAPAEAPQAEAPKVDDLTQRFLNDELAQILRAAEESASRIVERARTTTDQQIEESNRLWHEVQAEVARFAAWRDEVEPVIHAVQSKVDDVRTYIDEVPERIREALAPVAESISSIDSDLADLASRATPPLLLTPSGVAGSSAAGSAADETDEPEAEAEPPATEEPFDPMSADADSAEDGFDEEPAPEDLDDQAYDVPFGEGWTEVGDRPFDGGPDHSFGASAG
jgi:cell division septum initiation protein DivIVA